MWEPEFDLCLIELRAFLYEPNIDYDVDIAAMNTFMKLAAFAWYEMIPKDAVLMCIRSNEVVMNIKWNLEQNLAEKPAPNRTCLGTFIKIYYRFFFIKRSFDISSLQLNHFGKQLYQSL